MRAAGTPDDAAYRRIARHLRGDVPREDLTVLPFALANDAVDRGDLQIPKPYLERLAATLVGKPLLLHHDKSSVGEGVWYDAQVRPALPGEAGSWTLEATAYLLKTAGNAELRAKIEAGIAQYCSISFRFDRRLCSACGQDYFDCPHYRGQKLADGTRVALQFAGDLDRYEALEGSIVYLGQQKLARLLDASEGDHPDMDVEKLAARLEAAEAAIVALAPKPVQDPPGVDLAADGRAYRAELAASVAHLAGIVGAEIEAKAALLGCEMQPTAALIELRDAYQKQVDEKFPASGRGNLIDPATHRDQQQPEEGSRRGRRFTL